MLSLLTSAKLLCVVNSVTAIALPLQEIGSQKLLGEWVAIWKIQEAHWFDGETARYQPSQDIIYTLMFEPSGRATLNGKSFRYSLRQPNKVALYALIEKNNIPHIF